MPDLTHHETEMILANISHPASDLRYCRTPEEVANVFSAAEDLDDLAELRRILGDRWPPTAQRIAADARQQYLAALRRRERAEN